MLPSSIRLSDLHDFITCPVCQGYLIDATTVNECLHTFCKSCIVKHVKNNSNECPKCNTIIHERRPLDYVIQDRSKQDIVYKLVPQLYISELNRKYAIQELPFIDSLTKSILKKNFIYVVLVQRKQNWPTNDSSSTSICSLTSTASSLSSSSSSSLSNYETSNKCSHKKISKSIYLRCPIDITVSHLRKLLIVKFQLRADDRVSIFYKGDIVSDSDHVSNLAQSLTFCLHFEISRVLRSIETACSTSLTSSNFESASTSSSSMASINSSKAGTMITTKTTTTTATVTISTSTTDDSID